MELKTIGNINGNYRKEILKILQMDKQTVQSINNIHGNPDHKHGHQNIFSLNLIESKIITEEAGQKSEFRIRCPNNILYDIDNLKYYLKNKLEDLEAVVNENRSNFKKPCFNCSSSFHGSRYEDGHFNIQKIFEAGQKCITCQRDFTTERSFHHNCNICNTLFKNCLLLVHHHSTEHNSKKPYQCAACYLSLSNSTALKMHINKHKLPHKCLYCNKRRFATKTSLQRHMQSHTGEKLHFCNFCPKKYASKCSLEHTGGKLFKCNLCNRTFAQLCLLNRHKFIHMEKPYQCKYCPKQYRTNQYLDIHLFEHTGGKQFKCDLCDKTFAKRHELIRHKNRDHMDKFFQCKYCDKQYRAKKNLYYHLFEHTGGKQIKCDLCDKTFADLYKLSRHKPIHMDTSFQCKYCPKKYRSKESLNLHLFEHNGGKLFKCDLCGKTFAKQFQLNKHKITHIEKTFQCTICSKFFKTPPSLRWHIRRVHKVLE